MIKNLKLKIIIIVILILSMIVEIVILVSFKIKKDGTNNLYSYALEIVKKCKDKNHRPSCYDTEIPELMDKISMEDAFKVTSYIQDLDESYQYCHVLGHNLSAREVTKDPSKWKEVLTRCPSGECSNGCLHGGLQEKFRAESLSDEQITNLIPELANLCEPRQNWKPTGLEKASCYHAMGHLTMYITNADVQKASSLCNKISLKEKSDYRQLCYDGVFMQMFQPLEPEDFALVKDKQPNAEEVDSYCNSYPEIQSASCFNESWPLFRDQILSPTRLADFCSKVGEKYVSRCYNSLFFVVTAQLNLNADRVFDYCSNIPSDKRSMCFADAAGRMIEVDSENIAKATEFCGRALELDPQGKCFDELVAYSTYNFHKGSDQYYELCNSLPSKWKERCLKG
jgi:hypothetical protein